ncbi:MAG: Fic family protein [Silicimonas sp.]|nr:Fic family protein [Silicimonas sp.]
MLKPTYEIPELPLEVDVESRPVLKSVARAYRALSDMRREAAKVPNQGILIDTLFLQEAQASSEIENYITTQEDAFTIGLSPHSMLDPAQKEVARYRDALWSGHNALIDSQGLITTNSLVHMFQLLKQSTDGLRTVPGTTLQNEYTRDIVYVPPQSRQDIQRHMKRLEAFINLPEICDWDPLVKMCVIHHQFESIHPFPDGNGRVGRILNILYLVQQGLLDIPILYLSRYITQTKSDYYRLLQAVRDDGVWEEWLLYMLRGIYLTAIETAELLHGLNGLLTEYKREIRENHKNIYSHELLNNLFRHPYTRIDYVAKDTGVGRQTAARHLDALDAAGLVKKQKVGRDNFYINTPLVELLLARPNMMDRETKG